MAEFRTRRGHVGVTEERLEIDTCPLVHARRLLGSWHGAAWLLIAAALVLPTAPFTVETVLLGVAQTGLLFFGFVVAMELLRYRDLPVCRHRTVDRDAVTEIVPLIAMNRETAHAGTILEVRYGDGHERYVRVMPLDDEAAVTALEEHGYPVETV